MRHKYLLFDTISEAELKVFEETFTKLIKISLWNTQGTQFLSKNIPHTGRVKELVKMFPNAKFIYLMVIRILYLSLPVVSLLIRFNP